MYALRSQKSFQAESAFAAFDGGPRTDEPTFVLLHRFLHLKVLMSDLFFEVQVKHWYFLFWQVTHLLQDLLQVPVQRVL